MKNRNGFTLIELLAVIIVIALIMVVTSTTVMGILKENKTEMKKKQYEQLVEAAESYIDDVLNKSDSDSYIEPLTASGFGDRYSGYNLLEYVGNCVPSASNTYCIREEKEEIDKKNSTVNNTVYVDVKYITRTIFFDVTAVHDYINFENFNITYDKDLYDMDYKNECSSTVIGTLDPDDEQRVKCEKREKMINDNNNACGLKVVIKIKKVYNKDGSTNDYYKLVDSNIVSRGTNYVERCVK